MKTTYIRNNPNPLGEKHLLDKGPGDTGYDAVHGRYHPWYRTFLTERGYYDIFLFNTDGDLVYTVFKEEDFSTNFASKGGEWSETDLGKVYRAALAARPGELVFADFKAYEPSHGVPASFIATPVVENGRTVGVLAFQMPIDRINAVMNGTQGLGKTGETLIVGSDGLMRNNSRFTEVDDILATRVAGPVVEAALAGKPGTGFSEDYRATGMIEVSVPMTFNGTTWAIIAVESADETAEPLVEMRDAMLLAAVVLLLGAVAGGIFLARGISGPIARMVSTMTDLARGKIDVDLSDARRRDEIGDMAKALEIFRENAVERRQLEQKAQSERDRERHRQAYVENMIGGFRQAVAKTLAAFAAEVETMRASAGRLNTVARAASGDAAAAGDASSGASRNVQTVAAATEELTASIREIAEQTTKANGVVNDASETASHTDRQVGALSEAADKIGAVIKLIRDIAEQTNLLALNATIEAARAGEMGKGFAVVASEVKTLANQTAKATEDIASQITGIQDSTRGAVSAIGSINQSVTLIRELTTAIAGAVEEQQAATQEIAQSVRFASDGTDDVARNVTSVSGSIDMTAREAEAVDQATVALSSLARELSGEIEQFLADVNSEVADRRASMRRQMNEVAVINVHGGREATQVLDASVEGARIARVPGVSVGDRIAIELVTGRALESTVMRVGNDDIGVRFELRLGSVEELLAA
ncbi:MAG: methyl-accepting chemotaxis protein [Hyphomicrobiales bacterium]